MTIAFAMLRHGRSRRFCPDDAYAPTRRTDSASSQLDTAQRRAAHKRMRRLAYVKAASRKSNLYDNISLLAPDRTLLAMIPEKKMRWYIQRGLVAVEGPSTVRLLFEPRGRTHEGEEYYSAPKDNACVVCGLDRHLVRFYIVPHEFRRHFPPRHKVRSSHDIVLLCAECNIRAARHSGEYRRGVMMRTLGHSGRDQDRYIVDGIAARAASSARSLLSIRVGRHRQNRVPEERCVGHASGCVYVTVRGTQGAGVAAVGA